MHKIIIKPCYTCTIDDKTFALHKVTGVYRMWDFTTDGLYDFEGWISQYLNINFNSIRGFGFDERIKMGASLTTSLGLPIYATFGSESSARDYFVILMRHLMQNENNSIEVVDPSQEFMNRLRKFGVIVAPLGDKLYLYPDLSKVENKKQKHETVLDDDSILTINVRKRKSLKLDFKE